MPFIAFNETLSGVDSVDVGANRGLYFAWNVTTEGRECKHPNDLDPEQILGVGFVAFGNDVTSGGILTGDVWGQPHWLNMVHGQFIAPPDELGGNFGMLIASRMHYAISPGTEVHLYILGDNL